MDTRKAAAGYRLSQWMHVIREQKSSGLNIKEFCREKGMSRHAYFYCQRELCKATCKELSESGTARLVSVFICRYQHTNRQTGGIEAGRILRVGSASGGANNEAARIPISN